MNRRLLFLVVLLAATTVRLGFAEQFRGRYEGANLFELIGVNPNPDREAFLRDLEQQYHAGARKFQTSPSVSNDKALRAIKNAYEILKDPRVCDLYEHFLTQATQKQLSFGGGAQHLELFMEVKQQFEARDRHQKKFDARKLGINVIRSYLKEHQIPVNPPRVSYETLSGYKEPRSETLGTAPSTENGTRLRRAEVPTRPIVERDARTREVRPRASSEQEASPAPSRQNELVLVSSRDRDEAREESGCVSGYRSLRTRAALAVAATLATSAGTLMLSDATTSESGSGTPAGMSASRHYGEGLLDASKKKPIAEVEPGPSPESLKKATDSVVKRAGVTVDKASAEKSRAEDAVRKRMEKRFKK